jgi:hypothetical protein
VVTRGYLYLEQASSRHLLASIMLILGSGGGTWQAQHYPINFMYWSTVIISVSNVPVVDRLLKCCFGIFKQRRHASALPVRWLSLSAAFTPALTKVAIEVLHVSTMLLLSIQMVLLSTESIPIIEYSLCIFVIAFHE